MIPEILVFSKRSWQSLSKDDQALVTKLAKEAQQEQRKLWYEMEEKSLEQDERGRRGDQRRSTTRRPFRPPSSRCGTKYGAQHAALIQRIQDVK